MISTANPRSSVHCDVVLGGQWGDEGKAKMIDFLAGGYDVIARFQGGANAGHTVVADGQKYVFHLIPSGILYPRSTCVLGNGVVIDMEELVKEIEGIEARGIALSNRLWISASAFTVLPFHRALDRARERSQRIGTTGRGIGPAYSDKVARIGIRLIDFEDRVQLREKISANLAEKRPLFAHHFDPVDHPDLEVDRMIDGLMPLFEKIRPYLRHTPYLLDQALRDGKRVLLEGAQGTGLDLDFGSYPFVTCSTTTAGGASTGSGIGLSRIHEVIGVFKASITRVGGGALPTALGGSEEEELRQRGGEFGATTGRARFCGWFDGVQAKYSVIVNGITRLALTKIDVLDQYDTIRYCTGYKIRGKMTEEFPISTRDLDEAEPVYRDFPGWKKSTAGIKTYSSLPDEAKRYLEFIEAKLDCPIGWISTGAERSQTLTLHV